ncbi:solute carrier family 22 member 9-like [Bradysia coprophila]|uniref:solute carrier family 22 member 9-like n=1 Tax=Bradysia coprophila TaxID=38358 RepID=UPI00187DD531|nr:solute carrier family 22 member 9-like [Bradysia coprophila]XP_037032301.1 solute carrier family 22 member 9-like [Bradysia coprophila]
MSEKVKVFYEKLPKLIDDVIAPMGRFQYAIAFMLCFNSVIVAKETVVTTFYSYQPNFSCKNLKANQCSPNGTCTDGYDFDDKDHTVVSEWSLICNREYLVPIISTLYFSGMAIGSFVCGLISDRFGRKPTLLLCLYAQGVIGLSLSIVYDINWFIALRFLQGFFVQGLLTSIYVLLMEYCSPTKRTIAGMSFEIMWAVGLIYLGGVAYAVRDWRDLQLVLAIPTIVAVTWTWLIPESMQWLCTNDRKADAFKVCVQTAKYNGNYSSIEVEHRYWLENIEKEPVVCNSNSTENNTYSAKEILRDIFTTRCLKKHIFIMASTWFIVSMCYYGILLFIPSMPGDRHINFIIGGLFEMFTSTSMYFALAKFGRTKTTMVCLCLNGILLVVIGVCSSYGAVAVIQITTAVLSRGIASALIYVNFVQGNELFPTITRGCASGICGLLGKFGTVLAPFVLPLAKHVSPILPMAILGILSILSGLAQYFLPETLNIQTPNSVADAQKIWE